MMKTDTNTNEKVEVISEESPTVAPSTTATSEDNDNASTISTGTSKPLKSVKPTFGRIFQLIHGEVHILILALLFILISEGANLATPYIIALAYDALESYFFQLGSIVSLEPDVEADGVDTDLDESFDKSTMKEISMWMGVTLGLYLFGVLTSFVGRVLLGILGERLVARLRTRCYDSVLKQEIGFFDEHKTGEIVSRLGSDTQLLQQTISTFGPESFVNFIKAIMSIVLMFIISVKLTGLAVGGMFLLCVICIPFGQYLGTLSKKYQDILGEAQTLSTEALGSIRTVQSFAAESKELNKYVGKIGNPDAPSKPETESTYSVGAKKAVVNVGVFTLIFGGAFGFLYCTLWYAFYLLTIEKTLTLGGLTAFQTYVFTVAAAIGTCATNVTQAITGIAASGRVFYLLERKPIIKNFDGISDDDETISESEKEDNKSANTKKEVRKSIIPSTPMDGNIAFENIMFSYPSRPDVLVLNAFNLRLTKNTTTALVGSSGSGKSTVVSLIQRFYDVEGGKITLDGVDITHLNMTWLRSQIGYVQQEPQLFGMTVRDNLTYGLSEADAAKVAQLDLENICRDANAHEFISSWPDGYDTMVGERGITLSGGQKQRIAIARALLTNCRILLLDEATSALDAESEHEVQKAIENAMIGRTVVVVAHRLSTIRSADQIVVMDNRKIVDVGTHDELLQRCKRYQELIKRQSTMIRDVSSGTLQKMIPKELT